MELAKIGIQKVATATAGETEPVAAQPPSSVAPARSKADEPDPPAKATVGAFVGKDEWEELAIPDFLDRVKNPRPGDVFYPWHKPN